MLVAEKSKHRRAWPHLMRASVRHLARTGCNVGNHIDTSSAVLQAGVSPTGTGSSVQVWSTDVRPHAEGRMWMWLLAFGWLGSAAYPKSM